MKLYLLLITNNWKTNNVHVYFCRALIYHIFFFLLSLDTLLDLKVTDSSAIESYRKTFKELCPGKRKEDGIFLQQAEVAPSPRILKSNFALSLHSPDILDKAKVRPRYRVLLFKN